MVALSMFPHKGLAGSEHAVHYTFTNYILQMDSLQQLLRCPSDHE